MLFEQVVDCFHVILVLERENRCEFRPYVVTRVAGDSAKQRQPTEVQHRSICCAGPVVSLLKSECHPGVQFVLNVPGKKIATTANGSKPSCILRQRLVKTVIEICGPPGVAAFRIGMGQTRKRKAELHKTTPSAHWSLRRDGRCSIQ